MARKQYRDRALDWITRWRQVASREVKAALKERGLEVRHKEHPDGEARVVPHRRYKFDWAVPGLKVAVEIDGGNYMTRYSKKLKRRIPVGRHTKSSDYEKRNLAAEAGWTVLFYTTEMLENAAACVEQVERVIWRKIRSMETDVRTGEEEARQKAVKLVVDNLPTGLANALPLEEIADLCEEQSQFITPTWVMMQVERAREQGHLVISRNDRYCLAATYQEFDAWRKTYVVPELVRYLDMLHAMGRAAKEQFGHDDLMFEVMPSVGTG